MKALWEFLLCVLFIRRCRICLSVENNARRRLELDDKENK